MNDENEIVAMVGTTGGAGTTRLTVELGATLARAGQSVALLDAAYATQGLSRYVSGRLESDLTTLLTDADESANESTLDDALVDLSVELPGRLAACPASAPFERAARAKTPDAAERLETLMGEASASFDVVLVDVPPVATNPSVAAVTAADRVVLVAPGSPRGADGVQRLRGTLADVGTAADAIVANRTTGGGALGGEADVAVPESDTTQARHAPASVRDVDTEFAPAIASAAEALFDVSLDLEFPEEGLLDVDFERHLPERLT